MVISGLSRTAATRMAAPRQGKAGGFRVSTNPAEGPAPALAVSMPSLLRLQEAQGDAVSDRDARRHADEMLDALRDMQGALLAGARGAGLERVAQLARRAPEAADPRLQAVQRALLVRVAVEQARAAASL